MIHHIALQSCMLNLLYVYEASAQHRKIFQRKPEIITSTHNILLDSHSVILYKNFLYGSLTQSVEYLTFNQRVARSSRARPTSYDIICPHRLARSRTSAFHADNTGSNPVGDAIFTRVKGRLLPLISRHLPCSSPSFGKTEILSNNR